jgi:hypothetical protein
VSDLLSERLKEEVDSKAEALTGANGRPLFTTKKTTNAALAWWQRHRYDSIGKKVVDDMDPADVLELDQALSMANEQARMGGDYGGSEPQVL